MGEVDDDARDKATKVLTIGFIILIVPINAGLIMKIILRNLSKFMYDPKKLTIISLAIGDIFLALFTLVIGARYAFEGRDFLTCSTGFSSDVYGVYLLTFVYGTGLVVLAVELLRRMMRSLPQYSAGGKSFILAFMTSAVPWVLGLIIVLPLTMAGINWDTCELVGFTTSRIKAWSIVSTCVPASLALLAALFVMCIPQTRNSFSEYPPVSQVPPQNPATDVSHESTTKNMPAQPASSLAYVSPESSMNNMPAQPTSPPAYNPHLYPHAPNPYPPQPCPAYTISQPPYAASVQYQPSNYPENVYIPQSMYMYNPPPKSINFLKEKVTLLLVCIVYFVCVLPNAGFYIEYHLNTDPHKEWLDEDVEAALSDTFYWLLISRSVLTPLIWICRLDD